MDNTDRNTFDIRYMDALAAGNSFLHRLDPRAKLVTTFIFVVTVASFDKYALSGLVPFIVFPVVLACVGGVPLGYLLKKALSVVPFAIFIGIFNPLIDRAALVHIGSVSLSGGWVSFSSIIVRFFLTVTAVFVLISLTGFNALCSALLTFKVPRPFVIQLLFFYRYLSVLADEGQRMSRARSVRSFDSKAMGFGVFVSLISHLLLRTFDRAERIYRAMRCRGFNGNVPVAKPMKFGFRDGMFMCGWIALFVVLRKINVSFFLGNLIMRGLQ